MCARVTTILIEGRRQVDTDTAAGYDSALLLHTHTLEDCMITESRSGKIVMFVDDHDVLYRAGTCITAETARRFPGNPVIPAGQRPWESLIGWCSVHRNAGSGLYKLWYDGFNRKPAKDPMSCVVCVATSNDGRAWEYPELQYHPFDGGPTNIAVIGNGGHSHRYCCSVVEDPKRTFGERYVMGYYDFGIQDGQEYPGLHIAHSDDGLRWTVVPGAPFHRTAYGIRHDDVPLSSEPAVVPGQWRDRFACIRDTEGVGQITLKPRAMNPGTTVSINANASGGEIRLELLDSGGRRIEGFTREQCEPVRVDSLAAPVRWDGARDGRLPSGEIMVRVHLRNAGIYAISFT